MFRAVRVRVVRPTVSRKVRCRPVVLERMGSEVSKLMFLQEH